ncbi:hypothetical protein ABAC460_22470 [Asticcacaulis sp. AC460]|uniref:hypothetical protein n=1 Tax=Asticcacaulis sp. AC460 TaxID=1282360 RepID=UPI0003C3EC78|nr:hypothetical protein [Asticcacaulis sp. AC460]ESQ86694.1 hypothetical protein ABAC460_22470 [Asticcacaulis sp. AC460]
MFLADAAKMMTPAYLAILSKGYDVLIKGDVMIAQCGDRRFAADGPVALLGLISMIEIRGEAWEATDEEIDRFVAMCEPSSGER